MTTASTCPTPASGTPGGVRRGFTPGIFRDHTGSVRTVSPPICTTYVACPIRVTAVCPQWTDGGHVDRARDVRGTDRRADSSHRPGVVAEDPRREAAPHPAGGTARGCRARRRRGHLAQPLRPPRRAHHPPTAPGRPRAGTGDARRLVPPQELHPRGRAG